VDDSDSSVAQYDLIENNVISGVGRYLAAGEPMTIGNAHHVMIRHNEVFDDYTYAIQIGSSYSPDTRCGTAPCLAHDNTVALNSVHDVGQGVTSDIGGIYTAVKTALGTRITGNVVHDVVHDPNGYGGWGLYFDNGSSTVTAEDNLVYRTSQATVHHNYGGPHLIRNNILAYGAEGILERTNSRGTDALSFTFTNNLLLWDQSQAAGGASPQRGDWACTDPSGASVPCAQEFALGSNLYWYTGGSPMFVLGARANRPDATLSFATWQSCASGSPCEDSGSMVADPQFRSPATGDFSLLPGSPAASVGFVPFDPSQAGRIAPSLELPPPVPAAYPLQLGASF
jgi:hypothetical protein